MKLASLEIFQFQISLIKPLNISGQIYSSRRGLVIRLTDDHGHFGVSEIAPLPGWHQENIQEACHQLKEEAPRFLKAFPLQSDGKDKFISVIPNEWDNFYPSVRWGMEIALLQLRANQNSCHLYHLSNESYQPFIHINALLTGKNHEILHNASDRLAEGYHTLKVKVGRSPIDKEIKLIKELRDSIGPEPKIRLDANQSWNFSQAISFLRAVKDVGIEYIEEPVQEIKDLSKLQQDSDIMLALDESLYGQSPEKIQLPPNVKYLILKPTRMGGMKRVFDWIGL
ncbi:MAG: o-succinylbenzoate synthase, partial [bacterium]